MRISDWSSDVCSSDLLDYGCGSGILAIAAKMLGTGVTLAVDIDEQAVQSTRYNAKVNRVELEAMLPDALPDGQFQLVVANLLSNPLKVLAPMLANRVRSEESRVGKEWGRTCET